MLQYSVQCVESVVQLLSCCSLIGFTYGVPGSWVVQSLTLPRAIRRPVVDMHITLSRACGCPVFYVYSSHSPIVGFLAPFACVSLRPLPDMVDQ